MRARGYAGRSCGVQPHSNQLCPLKGVRRQSFSRLVVVSSPIIGQGSLLSSPRPYRFNFFLDEEREGGGGRGSGGGIGGNGVAGDPVGLVSGQRG